MSDRIITPVVPNDTFWLLGLRQLMLWGGSAAVGNGYTTDSEIQMIVGGLIGLISTAWTIWRRFSAVPAVVPAGTK